MTTYRRTKPRHGRLKGAELEKLRLDCWRRDGERCVKCHAFTFYFMPHQSDISYHMSHIVAKARGGDSLDNVETLCGRCHRKFHNYGPSMEKPCKKKS